MTQRYMHLSPAALDAAIRLLEEPAGPLQAGRGVQDCGDVGRRPPGRKTINKSGGKVGGEAGIRTLGTTLRSYNGLANRRFRPLSHLTATVKCT